MDDLDIMKRAKQYIADLANGIDPLTGAELPDSDIVNNVRISRCLYYTAGILQKVIDNGGEVQREKLKRSERAPFALTDEQALALKPADEDISISKVTSIINAQIDEYTMKKLKAQTVNEWLLEKGLLRELIINGKTHKNPTYEGEAVGIILKDYVSRTGMPAKINVYTPEAQQFIFDNIDSIIEFANAQSSGYTESNDEE